MQRRYVGICAYGESWEGRFKASDKLRIERTPVFVRSGLELFVKGPRQPVLRTMGVFHSVYLTLTRHYRIVTTSHFIVTKPPREKGWANLCDPNIEFPRS